MIHSSLGGFLQQLESLWMTECDFVPGEVIYEDEFQAAMLRAEGVEVSSELRILDLEKYKIKR